MATHEITQADVLRALEYDPDTGIFTWRRRADRSRSWNTRFSGKLAGGVDVYGYRSIMVEGRLFKAHRLAWLVTYGRWPNGDIDHHNRDRLDNRIVNLRECSRAENMQNQGLRRDNKTGYPGVTFCRSTGRWRARIRVDGDYIHLGRFDTPELARDRYLTAKAGIHQFHPTVDN